MLNGRETDELQPFFHAILGGVTFVDDAGILDGVHIDIRYPL